MRTHPRTTLILSLLASFALAPVAHGDEPPARRGAMIKRLEARLHALDLKPEQREKVDQILADAATKLSALREDADLAALRDAAGEVFRETHTRLAGVLTAEQLRQLESSMPRRMRDAGSDADAPVKNEAPAKPASGEAGMSETKDGGEMMSDTMSPAPAKADPKPASDAATDTAAAIASLVDERFAPGTPAPAFTLKNLDGKPVALTKFRGKPTVLLFGSFTSPTFRDKADAFERLRKEYRSKANFVVIYTREAYPNNEWDVQRNINEQIRVGQHTTYEERIRMAKLTADGMKIEADVLVDDIDDGVARAYDAMPNGCVVIDAQGKIVRKQRWAEMYGVKLAIDEALRAR
jgi:thiol-disulfide isomerase/thioredoxin